MNRKDPAKKPLAFGTSYEQEIELEMERNQMIQNDPGWIPGYSEQVRANEIANIDPTQRNFTTGREFKSKDGTQLQQHYFRMLGKTPKPLPVRFKWVRVSGMDGTENKNVRTDMAVYTRDGYKFAKLEDLQAHGYEVPPVAEIAADGLIRRGDVALMVVDAEGAKKIEARKALERAEADTPSVQPGITVERTRESNYVLPPQS